MTSPTPGHFVRCHYDGPLGRMTLAAGDQGLSGVWFDGQKHMPDIQRWQEQPAHPVLQQTVLQLQQYFAGQRRSFELPLDLRQGSAFQQAVWRGLLEIAAGRTESYRQLSQRIGKPSAVRAVAAAVGRNPLSIVVPCHRVIGADGSLTGYAGGLERKADLLKREQAGAGRGAATIPA